MAENVYLATITLFLGAFVLVFAMKYGSAALTARAKLADEVAHRTLAERSAAIEADTAAALAAIRGDLARVAEGVATVERILRQVG